MEGTLDKNIVKTKMETLKEEKAKLESRSIELDIKTYEWLDEDKITKYILKSKEDLNPLTIS
ncbi:hypothetical protein [Pseudobacteroides cellulosolvens]|uniref:Uncharacterized protein n=1 Tax=Pseudobacteroides cellulosolvens ATCC 35603 = DSM 2933 TaxID=398512 RepID=A0A0L6JT50_9FIRM|nr:hypothetical protein [Pseudobacteroides cellulosolvens]KNY28993.1 hypothetical protein Bccel_4267 [Pseudobacteroides cellulosolvens ATCC 35603 = DSM 2933]